MKKKSTIKRIIWFVVGCISFALGTLGTVLPVLPTVPLYLLAGFGFANYSIKLHSWFVSTKLYKRYLDGYIKAGGLTLKVKLALIGWVTLQIGILAVVFLENIVIQIILGILWLGFMLAMTVFVKTIDLKEKKQIVKDKVEAYRTDIRQEKNGRKID